MPLAMNKTRLEAFTAAYREAALWSSTDDDGKPLDEGDYQLAPETIARFEAECLKFWVDNGHLLDDLPMLSVTYAGHDFWLTRNGHGAGFWDGDWSEPLGSTLDAAAKAFSTIDLYVGDDGQIHAS